eukprot:1232281-Amphidinium_carterae.1
MLGLYGAYALQSLKVLVLLSEEQPRWYGKTIKLRKAKTLELQNFGIRIVFTLRTGMLTI